MARKKPEATKLFVLDTNIIMHDPTCLFQFKEHDIYIPECVLEELDNHKKGTTELARNVRQAMRVLTELLESVGAAKISTGILLASGGNRSATGRLFFQTEYETRKLPEGTSNQKADNQILAILALLKETRPNQSVVLVSKDINIKVKASVRGILSEDYENDNVLEDSDVIYSGIRTVSSKEYHRLMRGVKISRREQCTEYRVSGGMAKSLIRNESLLINDDAVSENLLLVEGREGSSVILRTLEDYTKMKHSVWGVCARTVEQNVAFNFLMNPEIDLVTMLGPAGTGKTLLALAAGLEQMIHSQLYGQIIMTRATIPMGEEIGFLPGTEEEKMGPWMGALTDNLDFLCMEDATREGGRSRVKISKEDILRNIAIKSMSFMRGRTFIKKFLIIDEAQNLTAKQMRALITRAGSDTKVVCLGNLAQIDTPYLTEGNSGITYAVERFKGWKHYGHVTLNRVERSRLAEHASEAMRQ